jgi:hypothetical protein
MRKISMLSVLVLLASCSKEEVAKQKFCQCSETVVNTGEVWNSTLTEGACEQEIDETTITFDFGELRYVCETVEL